MASTPEERLVERKITLPPPGTPMAKYKMAVRVGNTLYVSGHGPTKIGDTPLKGKLGSDLTVKQGKATARSVGLNILSTVKATLGSLDKVKRVVKSLGMVNSSPDFTQQPEVINGYSELMPEVFGDDAGVGTRSAIGMGSLPGNIPVEIEAIFEVE